MQLGKPVTQHLSMAEESDGRFVGLLPELQFCEAEGIEESDRRVEALRQTLEIGLRLGATDGKGSLSKGPIFMAWQRWK